MPVNSEVIDVGRTLHSGASFDLRLESSTHEKSFDRKLKVPLSYAEINSRQDSFKQP